MYVGWSMAKVHVHNKIIKNIFLNERVCRVHMCGFDMTSFHYENVTICTYVCFLSHLHVQHF